jgi:hypothetical protein
MAKLKKRDLKKALKELMFEPAPLSTNKGRFIRDKYCCPTPKQRRHKGWITARWAEKGDYQEEMAEGNDPIYFYDAWQSYRDGLPNWKTYKDLTHFHSTCRKFCREENEERNLKIKKWVKIREAKRKKELQRQRYRIS